MEIDIRLCICRSSLIPIKLQYLLSLRILLVFLSSTGLMCYLNLVISSWRISTLPSISCIYFSPFSVFPLISPESLLSNSICFSQLACSFPKTFNQFFNSLNLSMVLSSMTSSLTSINFNLASELSLREHLFLISCSCLYETPSPMRFFSSYLILQSCLLELICD